MALIDQLDARLEPLRAIPMTLHGFFDYIGGFYIATMPLWLNMQSADRATVAFLLIGVAVMANAVVTDYHVGVVKLIKPRVHLMIDAILGGLLALSPWILGFNSDMFWPQVIFGLILLIDANMTRFDDGPADAEAAKAATPAGPGDDVASRSHRPGEQPAADKAS